jgi:hypothetical protein
MNISSTSAASALQNAETQDQVKFAIAKKSLDAQKQQGDAVVKLIEQAAEIQQNQASSEGVDIKA